PEYSAIVDQQTHALAECIETELGGDGSLTAAAASVAIKTLDEAVGLVFIDANADLNTPETTPSGYLHGMALALALGRGDPTALAALGSRPAVQPAHVALGGFRALDPGERGPPGELALAPPASPATQP